MAGEVSKTFGLLLTVLGIVVLLGGLLVAAYGIAQVDAETQKDFPDEDHARQMADLALGGFSGAAAGFALLFLGIPLLVYGSQRYRDESSGRRGTRPGGALRAWALSLLILGVIASAVGGIAFLYGSIVSEDGRAGMTTNDARHELGETTRIAGGTLLSVGVTMLLVCVPFFVGGAIRARKERVAVSGPAVARKRREPADPEAEALAAVARPAWHQSPGLVALVVIVAAVVLAAVGIGFSPASGDAFGLTSEGGASPSTVEETFEGRLTAVYIGDQQVGETKTNETHKMDPVITKGRLVGTLDWAVGAGGADRLILTLEARTWSGQWGLVLEQDVAPGEKVVTAAMTFRGDVRATVSLPDGVSADQPYALTLRAE